MDTSKEYIRMCDYSEIQDEWEPKVGDLTQEGIVVRIRKTGAIDIDVYGNGYRKEELIWLLWQDQLQGMVYMRGAIQGVSTHICCPFVGQMLERFWDFAKDYLSYGKVGLLPDNSISAEQLWLAFVVYKLHSKTWINGRWKEGGATNGSSPNCTRGSGS